MLHVHASQVLLALLKYGITSSFITKKEKLHNGISTVLILFTNNRHTVLNLSEHIEYIKVTIQTTCIYHTKDHDYICYNLPPNGSPEYWATNVTYDSFWTWFLFFCPDNVTTVWSWAPTHLRMTLSNRLCQYKYLLVLEVFFSEKN